MTHNTKSFWISEALIQDIVAYQERLTQIPKLDVTCTIEQFCLLISGISTCRKLSGIPIHMGYEALYHCDKKDVKATGKQLKEIYGVQDAASLDTCCERLFCAHREYVQFLSFWKQQPIFDLQALDEESQAVFEEAKRYAQLFYPIVKEKGFYAWDANEIIGLYRKAVACDILSEEEFWKRCLPIARRVASWYENWQEFAIGCLCGACYFNYRNGGEDSDMKGLLDLHQQLIDHLLCEGGAWQRYGWYAAKKKAYVKSDKDIVPLLQGWIGADGCIASDRILVDGCPVGYMYREKPEQDWDSGWRFLAGDETQEYLDDMEHSGIYKLNTLCNYDPEIQSFLSDEYDSAYARKEDGLLHKLGHS